MPADQADRYLIEAIRAGDADAWRELIERYQGRLLRFARRMLAQPAEAEDLVQEAFVGLLRGLERFDASRSLETYLFAILRHKLHDHFRRAHTQRRQSLESLEAADLDARMHSRETPSRYMAGREQVVAQREALVQALRSWVETCQRQRRFTELIVVEMLVVLGMRNKEVAADLGLSETAVAGIKFRVLERWRKLAHQCPHLGEIEEADLSRDSTVGHIWREEGVSCLKRSTLGRYLLGALDPQWSEFVQFHVEVAGCDRCNANLEDLAAEEADSDGHRRLAERCFASSVGFLSRPGD